MLNFIRECLEALLQMVLASVWIIGAVSVFILVLKGFLWILRGLGVGI